MKSFLRVILNFLERKFPDKVVVTAADYLTLKAQMDVVGKSLETHEKEIVQLKAQIANMNVMMGLGAPKDFAGLLQR